MSNVSKGTAWATKVMRAFTARGMGVSRRQWMDAGDDLQVMSHRLSVEAKNHRTYKFGAWIDQAVKQSPGHLIPVVWAHRNGKAAAEDGFVVMRGSDFLDLLQGKR